MTNQPRETVADRCVALVHDWARGMLWKRMGRGEPGLTEASLRAEAWTKPEGRALRKLMTSEYGRLPTDVAVQKIAKSVDPGRFADAVAVLRNGLPG